MNPEVIDLTLEAGQTIELELSVIAPPGNDGADSNIVGPRGERGEKGDTGDKGADSVVPGPKGDKGDVGPLGTQGPIGPEGPRGQQGNPGLNSTVPGPQGIPGPVGPARFNPRGTYNPLLDYVLGDVVTHEGSSWFADQDPPVGETPSEASLYWHFLSLKGAKGDKGDTGAASTVPGPEGPRGIQGIQGELGPLPRTYSTSSTTVTMASFGSKTWALDTPLDIGVGQILHANSAQGWMGGRVTAISPTSVTITAAYSSGSASSSGWTLGLAGQRGEQGATGGTGPRGTDGVSPRLSTTSSSTNGQTANGARMFTLDQPLDASVAVGTEMMALASGAVWMGGVISAISATSVTIQVSYAQGSGTYSSWTLSAVGKRGAKGDQGTAGTNGTNGAQGPAGPANLVVTTATDLTGLLTQPGLIVQKLANGDYTLWVEDGT